MAQIKRIKCGIVNCFLLIGDGGCILVDTCNTEAAQSIYKQIKDYDIKLILLTHGHSDHIGSAAYLKEKTGAPVAMSEEDAVLITQPAARRLYGHTPLGKMLAKASGSTTSAANPPLFTPDFFVSDGEDLSRFGVAARVIALPGHTRGSIGVVVDGGLVAGDAAFNMVRPTCARLYEERTQMEKSVQKMKDSGAKLLYVGHGNPFNPDKI